MQILFYLISILFLFETCLLLTFLTAYSLNDLKIVSEIFNSFAIGISALLGANIGTFFVMEELNRRKKTKEYLRRFPHNSFGKDWEIVESKSVPRGTYYIYDKRQHTKHHILNMKTVLDLGWHIYLPFSKIVPDKTFINYETGDVIKTRGEAGG